MQLSRFLQGDQPSYQQSQQSHDVLVSKHLIPPPLSLLPKNQIRKPRSLTPLIPLPHFAGIIPYIQPLNNQFQYKDSQKGNYYNWIGQAFQNIVYKKYDETSYIKIDNIEQNWNICACDISKMIKKKSAEDHQNNNQQQQQIKPYYQPTSIKDKTLVFQSRFQSGNLSMVSKLSQNQYNLLLQNDINTNGYSQWFFFKVSNTFKSNKVKFNILNLYKINSLYRMGMQIVIYSKKQSQDRNISWHRGGQNISYFQNGYSRSTSDYKPYYTLTFQYTFHYDHDQVYFAYSYPYTYSNLQTYISKIQTDSYLKTICHHSSLCKTLAGNNVQLLTITQQHPYQKIKKGYVIITARIHPGESVSSYVCNGIIQFLLSSNEKAKKLRQYFIFKIIPMLNPDGVIHGNYRSNISGYDLNQRWENPSKYFHPEIYYLKKLISTIIEQKDQVNLFCDLHGHSMKKNAFCYGFHDHKNPRKGKQFPFLISKLFKGFSFKDCSFLQNNQAQISSRTILAKQLKHCDIYALQSSFCGPEHQNIHFSVRHFEQLGQKFCEAVLIHFRNKITKMKIQAAMKYQQNISTPINNDDSFETTPDRDITKCLSEIDQVLFKARVNSENSQGSQQQNEIDNILEEKTVKKYLLIKYTRPNSSMKRNFLLRKAFSKDNITTLMNRNFPKSTSPIKKRPLYQTPIVQKPKTTIKIQKKQLQKIQPKLFQPIDILPLGYDKNKRYRSHSKLNTNQQKYFSQKAIRNYQDTDTLNLNKKKSRVKLVLNKNFEFKKQVISDLNQQPAISTTLNNHNSSNYQSYSHNSHNTQQLSYRKSQDLQEKDSMFKNTWLKGFLKQQEIFSASPTIKMHKKGGNSTNIGSDLILKKNKFQYQYNDDKNGSNLFKNVLLSLRKDKK